MGLGGAVVMPQTLSIITNVFDPKERPRAIGIWATAVGIGVAIGPILGGLLLAHFWWGSVFLINVPLTAVGVVPIPLLVPETRSPNPGRIDYLGVLLSIVGLVLLVYGIIQGGEKGTGCAATCSARPRPACPSWPSSPGTRPGSPPLAGREAVPRPPAVLRRRGPRPVLLRHIGAFFFPTFYPQNVRGYTPLAAGLLTCRSRRARC